MTRIFVLALAVLTIVPHLAKAGGDPVYNCDAENILLRFIETPVPEYALHLMGSLETPTPGYEYRITEKELLKDEAKIVFGLELIAPEGIVTQVIDKVELDDFFTIPYKPENITFEISKSFNWGPEVINCTGPVDPVY